MNSAPSLELGMKSIMKSGVCLPAVGKVEDMKISRPPRLKEDDLDDPARFHRRLVEWLMKQR